MGSEDTLTKTNLFSVDRKIEVQGIGVTIKHVSSRIGDGYFYKEDVLLLLLELDEAVAGVVGFAIDIPVKCYETDELLALLEENIRVSFRRIRKETDEAGAFTKKHNEKQWVLNEWAEKTQRQLRQLIKKED